MENKKIKNPYKVLSHEELTRLTLNMRKKLRKTEQLLNVAMKLIEYDELIIKNYEFLIKDVYKNKKL